jgi:hypothetical protein
MIKHNQDTKVHSLSHRDAKLLNIFTQGTTSQDPFSCLQNAQSQARYITTWKQLICYWERVVEQGHLHNSLFKPSAAQLEAWEEATWLAAHPPMPMPPLLPTTTRRCRRSNSSSSRSRSDHGQGNRDGDGNNRDRDGDTAIEAHSTRLDHTMLAFYMAIIQHPLPYHVFDSMLVLYAAVCFWSTSKASWLAIGNYSSILS